MSLTSFASLDSQSLLYFTVRSINRDISDNILKLRKIAMLDHIRHGVGNTACDRHAKI